MKTKEAPQRETQKTPTALPLTVTLTGELAGQVRALAKEQGAQAADIVNQHLRLGLLATDPGPERERFRGGVAGVPVEVELPASVAAKIEALAAVAGQTPSEFVVGQLAAVIDAKRSDDITVRQSFTQTEWLRLERKAKLADCSALAMLTSTRDLLVNTEELVPCWIPQTIYNRLWQAAEAVELDADGIAETVLGDLIEDPASFADIVCTGWKLSGEKTAALDAVIAGWAAEETPSQSPR